MKIISHNSITDPKLLPPPSVFVIQWSPSIEPDTKKYLTTVWFDYYDYEGLVQEFKILYECQSRDEALLKAPELLQAEVSKVLVEHNNFHEILVEAWRRPGCGIVAIHAVNHKNKVIHSIRRKVGDGTGYNSTYFYLDIIELQDNVQITPQLFEDYYEVRLFFDEQDKLRKMNISE